MHALIRRLLVVAAVVAVIPVLAQTPWLNDKFTDGKRNNWLSSSNTGVSVGNQALSVLSGRHALTYFTPSGTQQNLAANESITVSFTLTFTSVGSSSTGFRVGLFDSQFAARPTDDGVSTVFKDYDGYLFSFAPAPTSGATSNNLRLRVRSPSGGTPPGGSLLPASTALMSTLTDPTPTAPTEPTWTYDATGTRSGTETPKVSLQTNTPYSATYTVSRSSGTALTFSFSLTDGTINFGNSYLVNTPTTYAFDAFAIYSVTTDGSNFAIDNVTVTAVPEPSTYAACAGAAVLGLALWRRRRAAAKAVVA